MLISSSEQERWPALTMALLFLGYAAGKAVYAAQDRLGFPTGPVPTAAEHARYAAQMMPVTTAQWMAVATGVVAALVVLATVTRAGRRVPRLVMLVALAAMTLAVGAGAGVVVVDGFFDVGIGWRWGHAVVGLLTLFVLIRTVLSYVRATAR